MERKRFEELVAQEFPNAVPERFLPIIQNVAFLTEDEPSQDVRQEEGLSDNETLLGLYRGVPATARGDLYGIGGALPDTITLYRLPIEDEAHFLCAHNPRLLEDCIRRVIRETIWHEVAHHFGFDEEQVRSKESKRDEIG